MTELHVLPASNPPREPPSKRRRVDEDSADSTPRYHGSPSELDGQKFSIRRGRPQSHSGSASPQPRDDRDTGDEPRGRYRSSTPSSHASPRSRSRSQSRSRSRSRSYTRSRSRSRSRSQLRSTSSSPSRSRSQSSSSRVAPAEPAPRQPVKPRYRQRLVLRGHTAAVSQVRISPDGRWIASASADGTVKIWDAETGAHLNTLVGHMAGVSCVAWAPDSNTLATGSDDKAIRLWDRITANPAHACGDGGKGNAGAETRGGRTGRAPLLGHHNYVYCLAFSPKGNVLASGSYDEAVFLWDVRAGRLMRSLPAHSDPVSGIDFCRDGTLVVSCSTDGLIRVWDTSTGQCLRTLVHEDNPAVTNVCFSPNGRFVLAFSLDSSIRLWDYVSGAVKKTYQGHLNTGFSIGGCFGSIKESEEGPGDGKVTRTHAFVASASEEGDIVLWDVVTKEVVQRIQKAHDGVCFWVDVNGSTMVSAGQDKTIRVYRGATVPEDGGVGTKPPFVNGVNGHNGVISPGAAAAADDELQRQIGEAEFPMPHVKEEQL